MPNRAHLTPPVSSHIRCKVKACRARFKCGWTLWQQGPGYQATQLDEPFPECDTGYLDRDQRYLHSAVELEPAACSDE